MSTPDKDSTHNERTVGRITIPVPSRCAACGGPATFDLLAGPNACTGVWEGGLVVDVSDSGVEVMARWRCRRCGTVTMTGDLRLTHDA